MILDVIKVDYHGDFFEWRDFQPERTQKEVLRRRGLYTGTVSKVPRGQDFVGQVWILVLQILGDLIPPERVARKKIRT